MDHISFQEKVDDSLCPHKGSIITQFNENVRGDSYTKPETKNDGAEGHWLEKRMGILPNSKNEPDKHGYEQKKESEKISFGDWSASWYIFSKPKGPSNKVLKDLLKKYGKSVSGKKKELIKRLEKAGIKIKNNESDMSSSGVTMTRREFIETFGSPNPKKNNRYSWSGKVFPKYGSNYNFAGQRMRFLDNGDLVIEYSYQNDTRKEKDTFKAPLKSNEPIILAFWGKTKLEKHVNNKFGVNGFYICKKNKDGVYDKICFGKTIDFQFFKTGLENGSIILDSGMYKGNSRNYSSFRAAKSLWNQLITEEC